MALKWEVIQKATIWSILQVDRVKVPGGWFVRISNVLSANAMQAFFYPDPEHLWDGSSLP